MNKQGKVLIVDDNTDVLFALNLLLEPYVEKIKVATSTEKAELLILSFQPDVILLDMNFSRDAISGQEGFQFLEKILQIDPQAIVIFMTAYSDTEKAVRAIKAGATDFIPKPWEKEKLLTTLFTAIKLKRSQEEVKQLKQQVTAFALSGEVEADMIGKSSQIQKVLDLISRLSDTSANILLLGENGTGKDLAARTLYQTSPRSDRPFVSIDLGSIPESLFESELFGYEKGAFTDARKSKAGRIEMANSGTLFLNEIGNLSMAMQAKLLTVIENQEISRLGSTETTAIDVRLICATNMDLRRMVAEGNFREDLLYRINTMEITIPPLRERGDDIMLLVAHFLKKYTHKYKKDIKEISPDARNKLQKYNWPGNVRELQHAVERAVILSEGRILRPDHFMLENTPVRTKNDDIIMNLEDLEKKAIEKAMKAAGGNISKAGELLGISRYALYRKLEKLDL